jgi:hypothetical protein
LITSAPLRHVGGIRTHPKISLVISCVAVLALIRALTAQTTNLVSDAQPQAPAASVSGIEHIVWVWFENREASAITPATAPYFASFAAANVNFTNFYGVTHPSQPNYLDGFSGSNHGVTGDGYATFPASTDNLAKQLAAAGKSWRVYAQNFPGGCSDTTSFTGGVDGPGLPGEYVRKHNPAISFENVRLDAGQCANIQPLANFDPTVNFAMVVPNMTNDMHDGTTAQGDAFLQAFVPLVTTSPDWAHTLLIVSFDEGTTSVNGGGHIYTVAAALWLAPTSVATTYNHFNLLRTIEVVYGLPFLGSAATATTMTELLPSTSNPTPTVTPPPPTPTATATLTPTPPPPTPSPTATSTPTPAPTATATPSSPTPTATAPPPTPTATGTVAPTATPTASPSSTPGPTVTPTPTPTTAQALNISTRLLVETGDNVVIGGFIITGSDPKNVAVRGLGPSLTGFGISDALPDPTISLRDSHGLLILANDNWQDDSLQAAQLTALGLAPTNAKESALVTSLQPAAYTAILAGNNQGVGVGLMEIYDTNGTANAQLANISTRGFVRTGENVMIGGFILGGSNNTRIVVRGIGPSLAQFGLTPVLADPTLELRDSNGALLVSNDNWQDDPVSAGQLSANGFALSDSKESGIFTSLPAGQFTAILAGKNGGIGIGLVEIYNLR